MLRASLSASSLVHHSAGWSARSANMPRPPEACFGLILPAAFCSSASVCLSIAFCFSDRSRYSNHAFCCFLGSVAIRSRFTGLAITFMPITLAEQVADRPRATNKPGTEGAGTGDGNAWSGFYPSAPHLSMNGLTTERARLRMERGQLNRFFISRLAFRRGQNVVFARRPDVEGGQQKDADHQIGKQPADDHNRKRPLRVRSDGVRQSPPATAPASPPAWSS